MKQKWANFEMENQSRMDILTKYCVYHHYAYLFTKFYNRVFQAIFLLNFLLLLIVVLGVVCEVFVSCIYKLCDGFLAAMNKAYKMFDDEEQLEYCMGVAEEAKELLDQKLTKKEGKTSIEEDDPIKVGCLCEME